MNRLEIRTVKEQDVALVDSVTREIVAFVFGDTVEQAEQRARDIVEAINDSGNQ